MTWYPQTANGCLVQLPLRRRNVWRAITNRFENGERISTPDSAASRIEWTLAYRDLSNAEASAIRDFYRSARGAFGTFAFVDPGANLLGHSDDPASSEWQSGLLQVTPGVAGPDAAPSGFRLTNTAGAAQRLSQTVALPGQYTACFSVWVRSAGGPVTVTLRRGTAATEVAAPPRWRRYYLTGIMPGEDAAPFSIELAAGHSVEVSGAQVEAGPYPSVYKSTGNAAGIYEHTSFASNELAMTATGVGLSACDFTLISRL